MIIMIINFKKMMITLLRLLIPCFNHKTYDLILFFTKLHKTSFILYFWKFVSIFLCFYHEY